MLIGFPTKEKYTQILMTDGIRIKIYMLDKGVVSIIDERTKGNQPTPPLEHQELKILYWESTTLAYEPTVTTKHSLNT